MAVASITDPDLPRTGSSVTGDAPEENDDDDDVDVDDDDDDEEDEDEEEAEEEEAEKGGEEEDGECESLRGFLPC